MPELTAHRRPATVACKVFFVHGKSQLSCTGFAVVMVITGVFIQEPYIRLTASESSVAEGPGCSDANMLLRKSVVFIPWCVLLEGQQTKADAEGWSLGV